MTTKFISNVLKATAVAAVPLAMLAASVPANAQRPTQRNPIEQRSGVDQGVLAQLQRLRGAVSGGNQYESVDYGNSDVYRDSRYRNENDNDGHYKRKHKHYKHGHYKARNENYKNGDYRQDGRHDDHGYDRGHDRDDNGRYPNRYPNQYPSRGGVRYPSSPVIPGFPNPNVPNGRGGKTLPGTNQQQQQRNNNRHHDN